MLCHNLLKRQVILLPVWILQLFWFSLNSRIQHMNCCFYQIKRLCALLDCCHLVSYYNLDLQTSFLGNMIEFGIDVANLATLLVAFIWATVADLNLILISHIWKLFSGLDIPASQVSFPSSPLKLCSSSARGCWGWYLIFVKMDWIDCFGITFLVNCNGFIIVLVNVSSNTYIRKSCKGKRHRKLSPKTLSTYI